MLSLTFFNGDHKNLPTLLAFGAAPPTLVVEMETKPNRSAGIPREGLIHHLRKNPLLILSVQPALELSLEQVEKAGSSRMIEMIARRTLEAGAVCYLRRKSLAIISPLGLQQIWPHTILEILVMVSPLSNTPLARLDASLSPKIYINNLFMWWIPSEMLSSYSLPLLVFQSPAKAKNKKQKTVHMYRFQGSPILWFLRRPLTLCRAMGKSFGFRHMWLWAHGLMLCQLWTHYLISLSLTYPFHKPG